MAAASERVTLRAFRAEDAEYQRELGIEAPLRRLADAEELR